MPQKQTGKLIDRDWLHDAYVNRYLKLCEIAKEAGCSISSVKTYLHRYGFVRSNSRGYANQDSFSRYPLLNDREWLYDAYVNREMSTLAIAQEIGCNDGAVSYMITKWNIPARSLSEAQGLRTKQGRNSRETSSNWKGGRIVGTYGYIYLYRPGHPHASSNNYVAEHRLVMEEKIGRYLEPNEAVHHIDGDKSNNSIENLALVTRRAHMMLHKQQLRDMLAMQVKIRELEERVEKYEKLYGKID